jgi:hypothetical protein
MALTSIDQDQQAVISTPLEYVQQRITGWGQLPDWKKATCKARNTVELAHAMLPQKPHARIITTPTNEVGQLDPRIDNYLLNSNPERWWDREDGGVLREIARLAAQSPPTLPRIAPRPDARLRLLFVNTELTENREGKLSYFIFNKYDHDLEMALATHHLLAPYFGLATHPCTWSELRQHKHRSLFINARGGTLPFGENLAAWGFHGILEREVRCVCNWQEERPEYETLEHVLFRCHLLAQVALPFRRQQVSLEEALGKVREIHVTAQNPWELQEAKTRQREFIKTVIKIWKRQKEIRQQVLANLRGN